MNLRKFPTLNKFNAGTIGDYLTRVPFIIIRCFCLKVHKVRTRAIFRDWKWTIAPAAVSAIEQTYSWVKYDVCQITCHLNTLCHKKGFLFSYFIDGLSADAFWLKKNTSKSSLAENDGCFFLRKEVIQESFVKKSIYATLRPLLVRWHNHNNISPISMKNETSFNSPSMTLRENTYQATNAPNTNSAYWEL